jgi:UDP-N-acetylmuramoyl-tripeptide--D-alanyl-D-alanine ligase
MIKQKFQQFEVFVILHWRRFLLALLHFHHRHLRRSQVVAITGSCGKTTTKDLLYHVLSTRWYGLKSPGTYNGFYTHAKILLRLIPWHHKFAVLEIGTDAPGKIDFLTRATNPDISIILHIGLDHYRSFRTREAVANEKINIIAHLPSNGLAVLNADEPLIMERSGQTRAPVSTFGTTADSSIRAENISSSWPERLALDVTFHGNRHRVLTRMCGDAGVNSVLSVIAVATHLGMSASEILPAIASFEGSYLRMTPVTLSDGSTFILDDWKSPLWSIDLVLKFLTEARAPRKILVLGTVSDTTGSQSKIYNRIIRQALACVDFVIITGSRSEFFKSIEGKHDPGRVNVISDLKTVADTLQQIIIPGTLVLLKGTTKQDHLQRLLHNRVKPIQCWTSTCRLQQPCRKCKLLYAQQPG